VEVLHTPGRAERVPGPVPATQTRLVAGVKARPMLAWKMARRITLNPILKSFIPDTA
jgi:hypothetical protein